MKTFISNAKRVFSKAVEAVLCRIEIARAVVTFTVAVVRLKKLHPVRDARKREAVGYQVRANKLAFELAVKKLETF